MTADYIGAEEALRIGLAEKAVPHDQLMTECESVAKKIMSKGPLAIQAAKIAINKGIMLDMDTAVAFEGEVCAGPFCSEDRVEGMKAFLEKRTAEFKNK